MNKKILFILLLTVPFINGFGQNIYNINDLTFNQDSSLVLLKSNDTPVSGILKMTCKRKGVVLKNKTNCEHSYKNGLLMSTKGYYTNKQISEETQRNGMCIYYYKNGGIESMGNQKDGMWNGVWKHFNKQGDLEKEEIYEEDELMIEKEYRKNGKLLRELKWTSNSSYIHKFYDSSGLLWEEGTYKNGKKEGNWKYSVFT